MKRSLTLWVMIFFLTTGRSQNISKAEYFFDADPGAGNGININIPASSDIVNFTASVSTASLASGFHFIGIRVKNVSGTWGLFEKRGFYISANTSNAANIVAAEYFFDADPGTGNGSPTSVGASGVLVNFTAVIPTSLPPGFHFLCIRTKDANGIWSLYESRGFYISSATTNVTNIVAAEYFFDADPGIGNAISTSVGTTGSVVNFTSIIPTSLTPGFHFLAIRTKDASGFWGLYEKRGLYVSAATANAANIIAAEYFFDSDPGIGNGIATSVGVSGGVVNFTAAIPTSLSTGFHFLCIRTKDASGLWGLYEKRGFYVSAATVNAANIVAAEYFFDSDPGIGNGTATSVGVSGGVVNFIATIPTSLPVGFHFLCIRTRGADGVWGLFEKRGFYISTAAVNTASIGAAEYYFDADPGPGNGTPLIVTTPGDTITQTFLIPDLGLTLGSHFVAIRVKDQAGKWGLYEYKPFTIGNSTITCPRDTTVSTEVGECSVAVNNIDPSVNPVQSFTYTLSGATTGNGTGTASGLLFNKGVTTVKYVLSGTPTVNCSFTVTVNAVAPAITTQPVSQSSCEQNDVTFSVTAVGLGLTYQWRKNAVNIIGATNSSYTINNVSSADAGSYDVKVASPCNLNVTSSAAVLTVGATSITSQPARQSVCPGSDATFSVTATGNGLTYQWRKNGANIAGATSSSLTISNAGSNDEGNYSVVVTSSCGDITSEIAALVVNKITAITTNPSDQSICIGDISTFSVTATGTGVLTYQWKKDGLDISGATLSSFNINSVSAGDAATYTVVVTGACGSVTSAGAVLTINPSTAITSGPVNQSSCLGSNVSFVVTATGKNLSYQWKKNGVNINGATSSSYNINSITAGDAASYRVVVMGTCGTITSNAATLSITAGTTINSQPINQSTCLGGKVTFSVSATGSGTLTYQWKKNGVDINGATSSSYIINAATSGDAATYGVVVNSNCGIITSTNVTLTIIQSTGITIQPSNQTVCTGANAAFSVTAAGSNLTYQWKKEGININGATSSSFVANSVASVDLGNYNVVVTGDCGSIISNTVSLSLADVKISSQPVSQTVCAGTNTTFSVTAAGSGITYQWRKNGTGIGGATLSSFTITGVEAGDAGNYDVVITGTCGTVISNKAALTINTATAINAQPASQTVCTGDNVTFSVSAIGQALTYQWRKGGLNIGGANLSSFTINNVAASDAANYDVVVTGICGTVSSANATLSVTAVGTWLGITSNDWNTSSNWCGGIPTSVTDVVIPSSAINMPNLSVAVGTARNITIGNNATLTIGSAGTLDLFGSVTGNGTFNAADGNINFRGTNSQSMPSFTTNNVTMDGNGGVVSGGDIIINGVLTLTKGNITLGSNNLTLAENTIGSVSAHIITNGTGNIILKTLAALSARSVPVASDANSYNPILIEANAGHTTDDITVRVANGVLTNGTSGTFYTTNVVDKTWFIDEAVAGGSNINITPQWIGTEELQGFDRTKCYIMQYSGNSWITGLPTTANGTDPYTQTKTNVTSFSPFAVQTTPIPRPSHGIFPNPVHSDLNVVIDLPNQGLANFSIYDAIGKLVIKKYIHLNGGITLTKINVADLSSGVYLIKVLIANERDNLIIEKFVKK